MGWRDLIGAGLIRAGAKLAPSSLAASTGDRDSVSAPEVVPDPPPGLAGDEAAGAVATDHLSQLFHSALEAETPQSLIDFVEFCSRFRRHSIFNARLIQTQRSGARACATAREWRAIGRYVLPDARPIIILWPFGPVAHVYDVEDTGPPHDRATIGDPFAATSALAPATIAAALDRLAAACASGKMFHIAITGDRLGFSFAGSAATQGLLPMSLPDDAAAAAHGKIATTLAQPRRVGAKAAKALRWIPSWRIKVNDRMTPAEQLVTVAHELGHIFCGHLGGCEGRNATSGWGNRSGLDHHACEIEAEAVAWLVARRVGVMTGSPAYLRRHVEQGGLARVNTDVVVRAAARIETLAGLRYAKP